MSGKNSLFRNWRDDSVVEEHFLLLQGNQGSVPRTLIRQFQLSIVPAPGELMLASDLQGLLHVCGTMYTLSIHNPQCAHTRKHTHTQYLYKAFLKQL